MLVVADIVFSGPREIRTLNLRLKRPLLYPVELETHTYKKRVAESNHHAVNVPMGSSHVAHHQAVPSKLVVQILISFSALFQSLVQCDQVHTVDCTFLRESLE